MIRLYFSRLLTTALPSPTCRECALGIHHVAHFVEDSQVIYTRSNISSHIAHTSVDASASNYTMPREAMLKRITTKDEDEMTIVVLVNYNLPLISSALPLASPLSSAALPWA